MNIPHTFEKFLASVVARFPQETQMILGSADASPESGTAKVNLNSYAVGLLDMTGCTDTREFDRAALGLKAFYEILTSQTSSWAIEHDLIEKISQWIQPLIQSQADLDGWSYGILFNDLGKLHISNEKHLALYGQYCADHDANMVNILKKSPQFYSGFQTLSPQYQQSLINGLSSGFNLGKAVQLECPECAWNPFMALNDFDKNFHLGHSFFDFIGVSGAGNPREYAKFIMNNDNITGFMGVITNQDYTSYAQSRLEKVGLLGQRLAVARLIAMSRIFASPEKLLSAVSLLSQDTREYLFSELESSVPAIELQYSPAILTLAHDTQTISNTLETFAKLFKMARNDLNARENSDIFILNLVDLAAALKSGASFDIYTCILSRMTGGWRLKI